MVEYNLYEDGIFWGDSETIGSAHRKRGPFAIFDSGQIFFKEIPNTTINRRKGPARISPSGTISYCNVTGIHRVDGPAVIYSNDVKQYWINGKLVERLEFFAKFGVC